MKKYQVNITVRETGSVEIEAESEQEARERIEEVIQEGNVYWDDFEVVEADVREMPKRGRERER